MVHISTRQSILPERWLSKECKTVGLTKEEKQINRFLEDFKGLTYSKYNELLLLGEVITAERFAVGSIRRFSHRLCQTHRTQDEQTHLRQVRFGAQPIGSVPSGIVQPLGYSPTGHFAKIHPRVRYFPAIDLQRSEQPCDEDDTEIPHDLSDSYRQRMGTKKSICLDQNTF